MTSAKRLHSFRARVTNDRNEVSQREEVSAWMREGLCFRDELANEVSIKQEKTNHCEGHPLHLALIRLFITVHNLITVQDDLAL